MSKQSLRISLFGAFAWLTVIALAGSHLYTSYQLFNAKQKLAEAKRQYQILHAELGKVYVEDISRVTASGAAMAVRNQWRFHVHRPQDRPLVLRWAFRGIDDLNRLQPPPAEGELPIFLPGYDGRIGTREVDFYLTIALTRDDGNAILQFGISANAGSAGWVREEPKYHIPPDSVLDQYLKTGRGVSQVGFTNGAYKDARLPDTPFVLLRMTAESDSRTREGLIVWLDDVPATSPSVE
jgi:hypothetical protein